MKKFVVTAHVLALSVGEPLAMGGVVTEEQLKTSVRIADKDVDQTAENIARLIEAGAIREDMTSPVTVGAASATYAVPERDPLEFVKQAITRGMILTGLNPAERAYVDAILAGEQPHPGWDAEQATAMTNAELQKAIGAYGEDAPRNANKADLVEALGYAMGKGVAGLLVDDAPHEAPAGTPQNPATSPSGSPAGVPPSGSVPGNVSPPDPTVNPNLAPGSVAVVGNVDGTGGDKTP